MSELFLLFKYRLNKSIAKSKPCRDKINNGVLYILKLGNMNW